MKIYTKRGDKGQTSLFGGARVSKSDPRVVAYGAVDAANSAIGWVAALPDLSFDLTSIMSDLFDIGAELATATNTQIVASRVTQLEHHIDEAEEQLTPLRSFILPTGCEAAARLHMARTAVRRAEQEIVSLGGVRNEVIMYINRLSDLLFVWARLCNHRQNLPDILWKANQDR